MDLPDTLSGKLVLALYLAPLLVAAAYDFWTFRIPNAVTGSLLAAFIAAGLVAGLPAWDWAAHLATGALVFAVGTALFAFRLMGGGDVKLLAAAAVWLGWAHLPQFLVTVALLGGALALLLLAARSQALLPLVARLNLRARILDKAEGIPYGIAIAAGGVMMAKDLPLL